MPIHSLQGSVAKTNTNSGTGDAHGRRYRKRELREDENGDGGTHFHGTATGWGVVRDFVAHDFHDVVSVGAETDGDGKREDGELPDWNGGFGLGSVTGGPGAVDD